MYADPDRGTGRTTQILLTAAAELATRWSVRNIVMVGHSVGAAGSLTVALRRILEAANIDTKRYTFHLVASGTPVSSYENAIVVRDHGC